MKRDKKGRFLPTGKKAKPRHHRERYMKREEAIDKIKDAWLDAYTIACRMKGDPDKRSVCFKEFLKSLSR